MLLLWCQLFHGRFSKWCLFHLKIEIVGQLLGRLVILLLLQCQQSLRKWTEFQTFGVKYWLCGNACRLYKEVEISFWNACFSNKLFSLAQLSNFYLLSNVFYYKDFKLSTLITVDLYLNYKLNIKCEKNRKCSWIESSAFCYEQI